MAQSHNTAVCVSHVAANEGAAALNSARWTCESHLRRREAARVVAGCAPTTHCTSFRSHYQAVLSGQLCRVGGVGSVGVARVLDTMLVATCRRQGGGGMGLAAGQVHTGALPGPQVSPKSYGPGFR